MTASSPSQSISRTSRLAGTGAPRGTRQQLEALRYCHEKAVAGQHLKHHNYAQEIPLAVEHVVVVSAVFKVLGSGALHLFSQEQGLEQGLDEKQSRATQVRLQREACSMASGQHQC